MSSPRSTSGAWRDARSSISVPVASKQTHPASTKKLPPPPPSKSCLARTENRRNSPYLVQFSYQQKRPRFASKLFSITRFCLVAATIAGISLGATRARSTELTQLHYNVLKIAFVWVFLIRHFSNVGPADFAQNSLPFLLRCPFWISSSTIIASYPIG
jgi:hypothetical protein